MYLDVVKKYINIDFDDDDDLIKGLIESAVVYLKNSGVSENEQNEKLYRLALCLLVRSFYDDRENDKMNLYISNLINQMRYCDD